jgi:hypothetical protein
MGVLERSTPLNPPADPEEPELSIAPEPAEAEAVEAKGRGVAPRKPKPADARAARRIKGRTIYLPDDLFERILVQAHRRNRTISEYVAAILDRQVPDHRVVRADQGESGAA